MNIPANCTGTEITTETGPAQCGTCGRRFQYDLNRRVAGEWVRLDQLPAHRSPEDDQLYSMCLARLVGSYDSWGDVVLAGYVRGNARNAKPGDVAVLYSRGTLRRGVVTKVGRTNITVEYTTHTSALESAARGDGLVNVTAKADKFENVATERAAVAKREAADLAVKDAMIAKAVAQSEVAEAERVAAEVVALDADGLEIHPGDLVTDYQGREARVTTLGLHPAGAGAVVASITYPGGLAWRVTTDRLRLAGNRQIVIIPCGAKKLDRPATAAELYTGSYHAATRRAAGQLTWGSAGGSGRIFILSALYGLLDLGSPELIEPYELRLGDPGSVDPAFIAAQAAQLGISMESGYAEDVVILAGRAYGDLAATVWPHARRPLAGSRGMGDQLARLKRIATRAPLPEGDGIEPVPAPDLNDGRMIGGPVDADGYAADMCRDCAGTGCSSCGGTGDRPDPSRIEIPGSRVGSATIAASEFTWQAWCHDPACIWSGPELRTPEAAIREADDHALTRHAAPLRPLTADGPAPEAVKAAEDRLADIDDARRDSPEPEDFGAWADGQAAEARLFEAETYVVTPRPGQGVKLRALLEMALRARYLDVIVIDPEGSPSVPEWVAAEPDQAGTSGDGPPAYMILDEGPPQGFTPYRLTPAELASQLGRLGRDARIDMPGLADPARFLQYATHQEYAARAFGAPGTGVVESYWKSEAELAAEQDAPIDAGITLTPLEAARSFAAGTQPLPATAEALADLVQAAAGDPELTTALWRKLKAQESPTYAYELWDRAGQLVHLRQRAETHAAELAELIARCHDPECQP